MKENREHRQFSSETLEIDLSRISSYKIHQLFETIMQPLTLSPLPILRAGDESGLLMIEREGFVDEAVVSALMFGPVSASRQAPYPADLALAADDLDFAGWQLSPLPESRQIQVHAEIEQPLRRPAPPVIEEPGLGSPHSGSHRWWLAGLAGILSTMLFSLLLINLSSRPGNHLEVFFAPRPPAKSQTMPAANMDLEKMAAELVDIFTADP